MIGSAMHLIGTVVTTCIQAIEKKAIQNVDRKSYEEYKRF